MSWLKSAASETQITHGDRLWLYCLAGLIMFLLVVPTVIVIPMSFSDSQYLEFPPRKWSLRWYGEYLETPRWIKATITSLKVAILTMLVATPFGTMAAYGLFVSGSRYGKAVFFSINDADDCAGHSYCDWNILCVWQGRDCEFNFWTCSGAYGFIGAYCNDYHHVGTANL